jgi:hypothetical protein
MVRGRAAAAAVGSLLALLALAPSALGVVRFAPHKDYAAGDGPTSVAIGEFNGDTQPDLAVANQTSGDVSLLFGNPDGTFSDPTSVGVDNGVQSVAVGDFNGDGVDDLVVANPLSGWVTVLLHSGGVWATSRHSAGRTPTAVTVGEFDGDSHPDLAVANFGGGVSIFRGLVAGDFKKGATDFAAGTGPRSVAVGDFNDDGRPDLAVANAFSGDVSVLLANGADTFAKATSYPAGDGHSQPQSVALGDFNGDAHPDLAAANNATANVAVLLAGPGGTFSFPLAFPTGDFSRSVAVGDFDRDRHVDLAVANNGGIFGPGDVSVLVGDGNGSFPRTVDFDAAQHPISVVTGDFNNDGQPDLAVANSGSNNVSVLINDTRKSLGAPPPSGGGTPGTTGETGATGATGSQDPPGRQDLPGHRVRPCFRSRSPCSRTASASVRASGWCGATSAAPPAPRRSTCCTAAASSSASAPTRSSDATASPGTPASVAAPRHPAATG